MRAFITGASGFVGGWLTRHLSEEGDEVMSLAEGIDLAQPGAATQAIMDANPEVIYHLAGLAHVGRSWDQPAETFRVNVVGTIELFEAVRQLAHRPRVLLISSAEVYGAGNGVVLDEKSPIHPVSPYAASKAAAEIVGRQAFYGRDIEVIVARPFNHVGPGQAEFFVVSALAKRVVEAELSGTETIAVGNLSAARDFTDVRDVVRAYRQLIVSGIPGETYNVCSGRAIPVSSLLDELVKQAAVAITPEVDPNLFRPVDVPSMEGSYTKLHTLTGWQPTISMQQTVDDVLCFWRDQLGARE